MRGINEIWTLYLKHCTRTIPIFECLEVTAAGKKVIALQLVNDLTCNHFFSNTHFLFLFKDILYPYQDVLFRTFQIRVSMVALVLIFALMLSCTDGLCKFEHICVCIFGFAKKIKLHRVNPKDYMIRILKIELKL